jgi:hypothetical protein
LVLLLSAHGRTMQQVSPDLETINILRVDSRPPAESSFWPSPRRHPLVANNFS